MKRNGSCYEIILNYDCNARCLFCSQGDFDKNKNASFENISADIYRAKKEGYKNLGLNGGEPTLRPDLFKIIKLARNIGFGYVRLQTNGLKISDHEYAEKLVRAGLTYCKFSLSDDKSLFHDRIVGIKGAWRKAVKGLENLKKFNIRLGNNILVNRFNYKRLPAIVKFFMEKGVSKFVIIYPQYAGSMFKNKRSIGVSLPEASPYLSKTMDFMKINSMDEEMLFLNVPPCFLPGYEDSIIGMDRFDTTVSDPFGGRTDLDENSDSGRIYGRVCADCLMRGKCRGVDSGYADLYGWKGFKPVKKVIKKTVKTSESRFFTDNERCFVQILELNGTLRTKEVLKKASGLPICQDCLDGNAVLNAGEKLVKRGLVEKKFIKGVYFWSLAESYDFNSRK